MNSQQKVEVVAMISLGGSRIKQIMGWLVSKLTNADQNVTIISSPNELGTFIKPESGFIIVLFNVDNTDTLERLQRFGTLRLYTNTPVWSGKTHRSQVIIADTNFSSWCVRNMLDEGYNFSAAKQLVASKAIAIPRIINAWNVVSVAQNNIANLSTSVKIGKASIMQIRTVAEMIDKMIDSDIVVATYIYNHLESLRIF